MSMRRLGSAVGSALAAGRDAACRERMAWAAPCRFSKELSTHAAGTWADARRLIVLSQRLSHRSVIFFGPGPMAVVDMRSAELSAPALVALAATIRNCRKAATTTAPS
jgi:hypothetical protein